MAVAKLRPVDVLMARVQTMSHAIPTIGGQLIYNTS
jgi:hypothetical protein